LEFIACLLENPQIHPWGEGPLISSTRSMKHRTCGVGSIACEDAARNSFKSPDMGILADYQTIVSLPLIAIKRRSG